MVRVLGPVQVVTLRGEVIDLPSASQRRLLAALALHAPRPVRTEWLCNVLDVTPGAFGGRRDPYVAPGIGEKAPRIATLRAMTSEVIRAAPATRCLQKFRYAGPQVIATGDA